MYAMRRSIGRYVRVFAAAAVRGVPRGAASRALLLIAAAGCGQARSDAMANGVGTPDVSPGAAPSGLLPWASRVEVDAATAGSVRGLVMVDGPVPEPSRLVVGPEACCRDATGLAPLDDALLVTDGRLANAVVWVASGLEGYRFVVPDSPADISHRGCRLVPRVTAVMTEQSVRVRNEDPVLHNTRVISERNGIRNLVQPAGAAALTFGFRRPDQAMAIVCDVHPWTVGAIAVLADPCFAVTGADGSYEISGLPPGRYVLAAWHELLGQRTIEVDVAPTEAALAPAIVFKGP